MNITEEFRRSMNWMHTWFGIGLAGVLFAIFWMGTLSVFDREIDQWTMPETRIVAPDSVSLDETVLPYLESADIAPGLQIFVQRPDERNPAIRLFIRGGGVRDQVWLDPATGSAIEPTDSLGGRGFFFPFHFRLFIGWQGLGYWIVGLAAMAMLALIVSGIFIHRKIIQDFFTFRPNKQARRSMLDMHNLTSLVALPFHFILTLSGILIFAIIYFPWSTAVPYGGDRAAMLEDRGSYNRPAAGQPGPLPTSLDVFVARAEARWNGDGQGASPRDVDRVRIANYRDANSFVSVQSIFPSRRVALGQGTIDFDPATGEVLSSYEPTPIANAVSWLSGLHFIQFDHWPLRWLYFIGGLSGCVMIATGALFWMRARMKRGGIEPAAVRVVRALTVGSVTGIVLASGMFLVANRLLPRDAAVAGFDRSDLEVWGFFIAWIATFVHAAIRGKQSWKEQSWAIAAIALLAVVLNWVTTGDHVFSTIGAGLWSIAGMDLVLLAGAVTAVMAALRLRKTERLEARTVERVAHAATKAVAAE